MIVFRVGVVGYGHWASDLGRKFVNNPEFKLVRIAEWDADLRAEAKHVFPAAEVDSDARSLCSDPEIDVVVITTQATMQHDLVRRAIANGKRVVAGAGGRRRRRSHLSSGVGVLESAWYRTALYCACIFYLSSLPDPSALLPPWFNVPHADKLAHAVIFGGLVAIVAADLLRWKGRALATSAFFLLPVLFAMGYGLFDEVHQLYVLNRSFDLLDWFADAGGGVLTAGAIAIWYDRSQSNR